MGLLYEDDECPTFPTSPPPFLRSRPWVLWRRRGYGTAMTGYDLLQAQISGSLGPKDFLEEIWTRNVVDLGDLSPAADQERPYARRRPQECAQSLLARLVPLNRYEQRALVRRQFAIKEFDRVDRNERQWAKNNVVFLG